MHIHRLHIFACCLLVIAEAEDVGVFDVGDILWQNK